MSYTANIVVVIVAGLLLVSWAIIDSRGQSARYPALRRLTPWFCLALLLSCYLSRGDVIPGDGHSHLGRTWLTLDALKRGELPVWSNRWYMGFPFDLYYGPLYYVSAALFAGLLGGQLFVASKLFLWGLHLGSALAAYRLGLARYGDRRGALVLALGYALAGYHIEMLRIRGQLALSLVFLCAPLLFLQRERLRAEPRSRAHASLAAALLMAAAFAAHVQYGAYLALGYLVSCGLASLRSVGAERRALVLHTLEAGTAALWLSLWLLVPLLHESGFLTLATGDAGVALDAFSTDRLYQHIKQMVTWVSYRSRTAEGYLGLSLVALALVAAVRAPQRADGPRVLTYPRTFVLCGLGAIAFGQPRCDLLIFLGVSVLAADGFVTLSRRISARVLVPLTVLLLLFDFGKGLVKKEYRAHDTLAYERVSRALERSQVPGRVLSIDGEKATFWPSLEGYHTELATPLGSIPQLAPRSLGPTLAIAAHVTQELIDARQPLSEASLDMLQLIGVRYLLVGPRRRRIEARKLPPVLFVQERMRASVDAQLDAIGLRGSHMYARRRVPTKPVLAVAAQMELSPSAPVARRALVADDALESDDPRVPIEPLSAQLHVSQLAEGHGSVRFRYNVDRPGFLRLAYSYAPFGIMEIDGAPVRFSRDVLGALVVATPAGQHQLTWRVGLSALRLRMLGLSGLTALILLACYALLRRREGAR